MLGMASNNCPFKKPCLVNISIQLTHLTKRHFLIYIIVMIVGTEKIAMNLTNGILPGNFLERTVAFFMLANSLYFQKKIMECIRI